MSLSPLYRHRSAAWRRATDEVPKKSISFGDGGMNEPQNFHEDP
jgi:hypothetical protein